MDRKFLSTFAWALLLPLIAISSLVFPFSVKLLALIGILVLASELMVWLLHRLGLALSWVSTSPVPMTDLKSQLLSPLEKNTKSFLLNIHFFLWIPAFFLLLFQVSFFPENLIWNLGAVLVLMVQAEILGHELSHEREGELKTFLLYSVIGGYDGIVYHVRKHHHLFATEQDELSLHFDRAFFGLPLRIAAQMKVAFAFKKTKLLWSYGILVSLILLVFVFLGSAAGLVYVVGILFGRLVAESLSVFSHYRLYRENENDVSACASWEVEGFCLTDYLGGYGISRHNSHHLSARGKAVGVKESPLMPAFVLNGILCFLCPPLFRKIMDQRLENWRAR